MVGRGWPGSDLGNPGRGGSSALSLNTLMWEVRVLFNPYAQKQAIYRLLLIAL